MQAVPLVTEYKKAQAEKIFELHRRASYWLPEMLAEYVIYVFCCVCGISLKAGGQDFRSC